MSPNVVFEADIFQYLFRHGKAEWMTEVIGDGFFFCDACDSAGTCPYWKYVYTIEEAQRVASLYVPGPTPVFICASCHFFRGAWIDEK